MASRNIVKGRPDRVQAHLIVGCALAIKLRKMEYSNRKFKILKEVIGSYFALISLRSQGLLWPDDAPGNK